MPGPFKVNVEPAAAVDEHQRPHLLMRQVHISFLRNNIEGG